MARRRATEQTPEQRVRTIMEFAAADFDAMTPKDQIAWWGRLYALQTREPGRSMPNTPALAEAHRRLRDCIRELASRRAFVLYQPAMGWVLLPPSPRPKGTRHSECITREADALRFAPQHMAPTLVSRLVDDLNEIGADRLRACPLKVDGHLCGKIFLATRRQTYCSPPHAQKAAWQSYAPIRNDRRKGSQ